MSSAGVGALGFIRTVLNTAYWEILELFLLTSFVEMLTLFSSRTWHLLHCQKYQHLVQRPGSWMDQKTGLT